MDIHKAGAQMLASAAAVGLNAMTGGLAGLLRAGLGLAGPTIAKLCESAGGALTEAAKTDLSSYLAERLSDPRTVLRNHDLASLVGKAFRTVLEAHASQVARRSDAAAGALRSIARHGEDHWFRIARTPGIARLPPERVAALTGAGLPALLLAGEDSPPTLDVPAWRQILAYLAGRSGKREALDVKRMDEAAEFLTAHMAGAVRSLLKSDLQGGGKAYAAFHLMALGELRALLTRQGAASESAGAGLSSLFEVVEAGIGSVLSSMDEHSRRLHAGLIESTIAMDARLSGVARDAEARNSALDRGLRDVASACESALRNIELAHAGARAQGDAVLRDIAALQRGVDRLVSRTVLSVERRTADEDTSSIVRRLLPRNRWVPYVDVEGALDRLWNWVLDDTGFPVSVRVITGPAGSGKTRLALELCVRAESAGWEAGFAPDGELRRNESDPPAWDTPTLVVVDYAAALAASLQRLLRNLAQRSDSLRPMPPLRILLLDRHGRDDGVWVDALLGPDGSDAGTRLSAWHEADGDLVLSPLTPEHAPALIAATLQRLSAGAATEGQAQRATAWLALLDEEPTPLLVQITCELLVAEFGETVKTREELLAALLKRDLSHRLAPLLNQSGLAASLPVVQRAAALVSMVRRGVDGPSNLRPLVDAAAASLGYGSPDPGPVFLMLRDFLGLRPSGLRPVEPGLLAEFHIAQELATAAGGREDHRRALVDAALAIEPREPLLMMVRVAQDFPSIREGWDVLDSLVRTPLVTTETLETISSVLPRHTVVLSGTAAYVERKLRRVADTDALKAARANNLGVRLSDMERHRRAAAAFAKAVAAYRRLADGPGDSFRVELSASLGNLGMELAEVGRLEDALAAVREAIGIHRELAARRRGAFPRLLAVDRINEGACLARLGRYEEARESATEAVGQLRAMASEKPDQARSELASALHNLSSALAGLRCTDEALHAIHEAVLIRRDLARARPDAFRPYLAASLGNLANRLLDAGDRRSALRALRESSDLYLVLAGVQPRTYAPHAASALESLGDLLTSVAERAEGLGTLKSATATWRALAEQLPGAYTSSLASSLLHLAERQLSFGESQEALPHFAEAVALLRPLAARSPEKHRPLLAAGLTNLAWCLDDLGDLASASSTIEEAIGIRRALLGSHVDETRPQLANSLAVAARVRAHERRGDDGVALAEEALRLLLPPVDAVAALGAPLVRAIRDIYLSCARASGREVDGELLRAVHAGYSLRDDG